MNTRESRPFEENERSRVEKLLNNSSSNSSSGGGSGGDGSGTHAVSARSNCARTKYRRVLHSVWSRSMIAITAVEATMGSKFDQVFVYLRVLVSPRVPLSRLDGRFAQKLEPSRKVTVVNSCSCP